MREQTFSLSDSAANSLPVERAAFIRRTYFHLAVALLLFTGLEYYLVNAPFAANLAASMTGGMSWLIVLGLFMAVSYIANKLALSGGSEQMQYLGLGLFIIAEAIVFLPLLFIATHFGGEGLIPTAGLMTLLLVGGITCSMIFGFSLGLIFSAVMIIFAGGSVLYSTSNILHQYRTDQHVAASLSLFASVALLFFYILQFLMSFAGGSDD